MAFKLISSKFLVLFVLLQTASSQTVISTGETWQDVLLPDSEEHWRNLDVIPYCWLEGTLRYALFEDLNQNPVVTVQGQIDNGMGSSISGDAIDRVARGFFFKDQTYSFASLDGFVVIYV